LTVRRDFTRAGSIVLAFSAEMRVEYRSMEKASLESSCAGGAGCSLVTWAGIWPGNGA
jgi:hypothetical protein